MKVPNSDNVIVDIRKLRDYCLNPLHKNGKHKARLFDTILGITADNAEELCNILLKSVKVHNAQLGRCDVYGQRYIVDFMIVWCSKQAMIRSAWIVEHNSNIPRLVSCYPL